MLQGEHSALLLTFIKLPSVIKIFVLSFFEWPLKTGFTVFQRYYPEVALCSEKQIKKTITFIISTQTGDQRVARLETRRPHSQYVVRVQAG